MPALMAAADLVVAPYLDTQGPSDYPLAIMEAMSTGKCVICSNVGGAPEFIKNGENGVLVSPGDAESLKTAINGILQSQEKRQRMGNAARQTIEECYSLERVTEAHINLYMEMMSSKKGG